MNPELQKELFQRLDALAAKLGVAAQSLWQIYTQQARVALVQDYLMLAAGLLLFLVPIGFFIVGKFSEYDEEDYIARGVISGLIVLVIDSFIFTSCIGEIIQIKLNLNYWILDHILNSLSNLK